MSSVKCITISNIFDESKILFYDLFSGIMQPDLYFLKSLGPQKILYENLQRSILTCLQKLQVCILSCNWLSQLNYIKHKIIFFCIFYDTNVFFSTCVVIVTLLCVFVLAQINLFWQKMFQEACSALTLKSHIQIYIEEEKILQKKHHWFKR